MGPPGVWGFWFLGCWGVTLKYPLSSAKSIMAWWVWVSGLDVRRLTSLLVVALFVLPLLAPLIAAVPVSAQVTPLKVTNFVITAGGELGFILNRTVLIAGHPVQGAPVLYFWASKNPDTTLVGDEFLLATLAVGTTPGVIFGTLLVNETIGGWLGAGAGNIYLKVTSSRATGAAAVVSDAFGLLVDTAAIERALKVLHAPTNSPRRDFAYYTFFGRSNYPEFVLNLSAIGIGLGVGKTLVNADAVNFTLIKGTQVLYAVNGTMVTPRFTNFLASPLGFGKQAGDAPYNVVRLNGTIANFALLFPTDLTTVNATITVAYQAFKLIATVKNGSTTISGVNWAKIDKSRIVATGTAIVTFNHTVASIGWTQTVNIYPTARFAFIDSDGNGFINVRDRVQIEFRNFKDGTYTPRVAFFARLPDFTYVELPVKNTTVSVTISSGTNTSSFEVAIPDNPYGGRLILATVNVSAGWALAGPTPGSVRPTIAVWGFRNDGTLIVPAPSGNFTAGEYIFVRGRGFLVETPTLDLMNGTVRIPLTVVASTGVFGNGSFGAIFQIPPGIALYPGNSVTLRVYTGDPATTTNIATITRTVTFDTDVINVFIEPRPRIISIFPPSARIDLGATKFPSPATWEPEATRKFTLLVYGFFATALRFNISLVGPATIPVALNVPRTGVGSLLATFDVPEAPFGSYQVEIRTLGVGAATSDSAVQRMLNVSATLAAVDPADGVAKKRVFLPVAVNLTLLGFGFEAGLAVKYDVPMLGLRDISLLSGPAASPTAVAASAKGSFAGWIDLPSIIRAPGVYTIRVHQSPAEAEIIITIGVPPPFTVRVVTGAAKFADLPLDIWVLAFYGGSIARQDQVTSVSLAVYLRVGDETRVFTPATTVAIPGQAVFYARFTAPADALGKDLLVVATVKAKFSPIAAEDTASDVTSVAIPPARLSDLISAITTGIDAFNSALEQLTAISGKLDTLSTALGTAVTTIRGDIAAAEGRIRGDIAGVRALVLEVNTNVGLVAQAVLTVADQNNAILARLGDIDAKLTGVSSGVAKLSTDVAGLATLIRSANLSITKVVTDQAGRVVAALSDSEDRIVGAISTNAKTLSDLITASEGRVRGDVKAVSDALAAFQSGAFSKLDAISGSVDAARADLARLRTDAASMASVVAGIQTTVSRVDTNVGGLVDTAKTIATTVDSINKAVPGLATKADVSGAQTAITGAIDKAKSDLQSAVKSAEDTASTSSRNWGVINAILVIIAIAILAYSTFVARRA